MNLKNFKSFNYLTNNFIEMQAKLTKFVQRKSKLTGSIFFKTFVFGLISNQDSTLCDLAHYIKKNFKVTISPQALDKRISEKSVIFLQKILSELLSKFNIESKIPIKILKQFSEINILDSTFLRIPNKAIKTLNEFLKVDLKQGVKIQVMFDFLSGKFKLIDVQSDKKNDQSYTSYLNNIKKNSLTIFDLGYFQLASLKEIIDSGNFFLSRYLSSTNVYNLSNKKFDLESYLKKEKRDYFSLEIKLGRRYFLKCRMIFLRLPDKVYKRRIENIKKRDKRKQSRPNERNLYLRKWTILVTNVGSEIFDEKVGFLLYSFRWQIELLFKTFKSIFKIQDTGQKGGYRILTELYGKLICIVINTFIVYDLKCLDVDLSLYKSCKCFKRDVGEIVKNFGNSKKLFKVISNIQSDILIYGKKEKRRNRQSTIYYLKNPHEYELYLEITNDLEKIPKVA